MKIFKHSIIKIKTFLDPLLCYTWTKDVSGRRTVWDDWSQLLKIQTRLALH